MVSLKFLRFSPIQHKFNIILSLIILILLFGLANFWFGIKVTSGIRGYVGGEGLWSKAQKEAVTNLVRYADTQDETYYHRYLDFTKVQAGDHLARTELDRSKPDYGLVRQGFVDGGNSAADVDNMVFLYRQFHMVSYMSAAIATWRQGDAEIAKLQTVAARIHDTVSSTHDMRPLPAQNPELASLVKQAYDIDSRLTILENQFSATLSAGSRGISQLLLELTVVTTAILGGLTLAVAVLIGKTVIRLDTLKTEFVSLASHQLRTPLTAINWYTEELLNESKGKLTPEQREYLTELYGGGKRMSGLISDLLRVSSLDLGTYKSQLALKSINEIVQTVMSDLRIRIEHKGIKLVTKIDDELPIVKVDDQILTVIFQNLLSNSIKYTPNGGTITVSVKRDHDDLLIHTADTGIGIPSAQQSQIFSKLFRADNAKQLDSESSGLGLYIVKGVTERLGGTIWFTSTEGKGSDFYVKLPIYRGFHGRSSK